MEHSIYACSIYKQFGCIYGNFAIRFIWIFSCCFDIDLEQQLKNSPKVYGNHIVGMIDLLHNHDHYIMNSVFMKINQKPGENVPLHDVPIMRCRLCFQKHDPICQNMTFIVKMPLEMYMHRLPCVYKMVKLRRIHRISLPRRFI